MTGCPEARVRTRAVRVTPAALRAVRQGHPWVYADSIRSIKGEPEVGDIGIVFDDANRLAAVGLLDPTSAIGLRILATEATTIDPDWLERRISGAIARREPLEVDNTGMRLVNGEGDQLPGLVVDRYDRVVVVKVYSVAWLRYLPWLADVLSQRFAIGVLRFSTQVARAIETGRHWLGPIPDRRWWGDVGDGRVGFTENGLLLEADVLVGHKTGHFFDQRHNRRRAAELVRGGTMLDVFACTGGFGLHAAAGGAEAVTLTDVSAPALAAATDNFARNGFDAPATIRGDAYDVMAGLADESFDLVVVDPPAFATRQAHVNRAVAAYRRLATSGFRLVRPGGHLVQASCSAHVGADRFVETVLAATDGDQPIWQTGHDLDHPIAHPEGAYLKAVAITKPV